MESYDIAIIGAGPGGYVAAVRAAELGKKVVVIDKRAALGGTCLNEGCIPSKTLLQGTELLYHVEHRGKESGLISSGLTVDFPHLMARKREVVKGLENGISTLFHHHKILFLQGEAEFIDAHHLRIIAQDGSVREVEAHAILIATGSEPIALPDVAFQGSQIVSSTGALSLTQVPKRLVVIGAGVIGVELASVYQRLGSQVTIIEMMDHICPMLDQEISKELLKSLKMEGIEFLLSSAVVSSIVQPDEVILTVDVQGSLRNISATVVLVAVGRRPHTEGLQLERAGIEKDSKGFIPVNSNFQTKQSHIFAIGDVIKGAMLAHRASAEGIAVMEALHGAFPVLNDLALPNVIYTYPEVASVGLTEEEGKKEGLELFTGKSLFRNNARARCNGETEGFVKVVGEKKTGRLVGMHMIGSQASELIAEGVLAMQNRALVKEIADAPNAHPTLSETIKEAAQNAYSKIYGK